MNTKKMGLRERKKLARRQEMLEAAMKIMTEDGFQALTIARLAKETKAGLAGIYRYFENKIAIYIALHDWVLQRLQEVFDNSWIQAKEYHEAHDADHPEAERLLFLLFVLIGTYIQHAKDSPAQHRMFTVFLSVQEILFNPEEREQAEGILGEIMKQVTEVFHEAHTEGIFTEADSERQTFTLLYQLISHDLYFKRDILYREELWARNLTFSTMRSLFCAWGAKEESVTQSFELYLKFKEHQLAARDAVAEG